MPARSSSAASGRSAVIDAARTSAPARRADRSRRGPTGILPPMGARLRDPALAGLGAVLAAGLALRVLLATSLWPVSITVDDAYESYARTNPFNDPLHPASLILAAIGAVTRQVAVTVT